MAAKSDATGQVPAAAMRLAARQGWARLALADIAAEANLSLAELYEFFPHKSAILAEIARQADVAVLTAAAADRDRSEETPRERLFDVLMARFDALAPYKDGIAMVLRDGLVDPVSASCAALCWGNRLLRSMRWTLEAAGIGSGGPGGRLRAKGLLAVYLSVLPVWLRDDSSDMGKTMAALDRRLAGAEQLARFCPGGRRGSVDEGPVDEGGGPGAPASKKNVPKKKKPGARKGKTARKGTGTRPAPA